MREIKFRAYSKDYEVMLSNEVLENAGDGMYEAGIYLPTKDEDLIFMQYTGLKDKKGKEIYECDVVICNRNIGASIDSQLFVVDWKDGYITFVFNRDWSVLEASQHSIVEVIGNIYENPELLA
ncbi:MAG: YopX family protein [Clostridia bacterium]